MKNITKKILTILVICIFCLLALGSGSSSEDEVKTVSKSDDQEVDDSSIDEVSLPSIEEQILFESDGVRVTAKEISEGWAGPELKVLIENDSDTKVTVSLDEIAVNDYMVSAWLYEDVDAGKKSNATFTIWSSTLADAGIDNIGKIDFYFEVINSDTYNVIYKSDEIEVKTSLYDEMDEEINGVGEELVNQNGIRIVGKGVSDDSIWGSGVILYVENNTDEDILVTADDLSINGYMIDAYLYSVVKPGKKAIDTIIFSSTDLEENDIESIDEISLSLDISDANTWMTLFSTENMSLNVE